MHYSQLNSRLDSVPQCFHCCPYSMHIVLKCNSVKVHLQFFVTFPMESGVYVSFKLDGFWGLFWTVEYSGPSRTLSKSKSSDSCWRLPYPCKQFNCLEVPCWEEAQTRQSREHMERTPPCSSLPTPSAPAPHCPSFNHCQTAAKWETLHQNLLATYFLNSLLTDTVTMIVAVLS